MNNTETKEAKKNLAKYIESIKSKDRNKHRTEFADRWVAIAKETNLDEETFNLLLDGFSFAQAEPLYRYATNEENPAFVYGKFHRYGRAASNKEYCTLQVMLSLFAYELLQPSKGNPLEAIVPKLNTYARKNKIAAKVTDGSYLQQLVLAPLSGNHISKEASLTPELAKSLLSIIEKPLHAYEQSSKKARSKRETARTLREWIEKQASGLAETEQAVREAETKELVKEGHSGNDESVSPNAQMRQDADILGGDNERVSHDQEHTASAVSEQQHEPAPSTDFDDVTSIEGSAEAAKSQAETQPVDVADNDELNMEAVIEFLKLCASPKDGAEGGEADEKGGEATSVAKDGTPSIDEVIEFLSSYEKEHEKQKVDLARATVARYKAEDQVRLHKGQLEQLRSDAELERQSQISRLKYQQEKYDALCEERSDLQHKLELAAQENERLQQSLEASEESIVMLEEHAAYEAEASDYQMAEELKFEYGQYEKGKDREMTINLGNIMRFQLGRVFEILEKHGINFREEA